MLTFGGYYSNHIYAVASAAKIYGFKSVGVIRGEQPPVLNATLSFAENHGMQLLFVTREQYRSKDTKLFIDFLRENYGDFYLIPEGGTNQLALDGVVEMASEIETEFDFLCVPCGTGGTLAGMVCALKGNKKVIGFSALKGEDLLTGSINQLVSLHEGTSFNNFSISFDYHFGGYAKTNQELKEFILDFKEEYEILLDPIYTGKMMYGIFDLIEKNYFKPGSKIIAIHTGGLQGWSGFPN